MAYVAVTLAQLQTALAARYEGGPFWSADQARRAINEGLRVYNLITGIFRDESDPITLIPDDEHLYIRDAGILKATRVQLVGASRPMTMTSVSALDRTVSNWSQRNTSSGGDTPTTPQFWAPLGLTEIVVYPKESPADYLSSPLEVTVSGTIPAPILVSAGDFLNLGQEEISTLLGYALHVLSFGKGIAAMQKTRPQLHAFYKACALRSATFAASSLYRQMIGYDRLRSDAPMVDSTVQVAVDTVFGGLDGSTT
jgi:hypothetical protein